MSEVIQISGSPNPKQKAFFASRAKYTAYGGARGGGKSWALRRKLVALCLRYPGISCLIVRRSLPELRSNHVIPILKEYGGAISYNEGEKAFIFPSGSRIALGYCSSDRDALRYQGQEYDIIAIDEATQLTENQFAIFKACLRGVGEYPRRMYLTCNPGGIGHAWVKRLFIDRDFRSSESPEDYAFISALVYDNETLMERDPEYVRQLESLPEKMREAWLYGKWNVFEGQFFSEFDYETHTVEPFEIPDSWNRFVAFDYGFDRLAVLWLAVDFDENVYVYRELCESSLTLSMASERIASLCFDERIEYAVASPDIWNRRQDSGLSGVEIMSRTSGMPSLLRADDRRVPGWRAVREYLCCDADGKPRLKIFRSCSELIFCMPALLHDSTRYEDAASEPHSVTHAPEALRYALMSRLCAPKKEPDFVIARTKNVWGEYAWQ